MKLKNVSALLLIFAIAFSILHEFTFAFTDEESFATTEHALDFNHPVGCDVACDAHCEYHHSYVLPIVDKNFQVNLVSFFKIPKNNSYVFKTHLKIIKPPIA